MVAVRVGAAPVAEQISTCIALCLPRALRSRTPTCSALCLPRALRRPQVQPNNIVLRGIEAHNLAVMHDSKPGVPASERWKALGGIDPTAFPYGDGEETAYLRSVVPSWAQKEWTDAGQSGRYRWGLHAYVSADGLLWRRRGVVLSGFALDSLNVVLWQPAAGVYRMFGRIWVRCHSAGAPGCQGGRRRTIATSTSVDFFGGWSPIEALTFEPAYRDGENLYTNAIVPFPGSRDGTLLIGFPKRFNPTRHKVWRCSACCLACGVRCAANDLSPCVRARRCRRRHNSGVGPRRARRERHCDHHQPLPCHR